MPAKPVMSGIGAADPQELHRIPVIDKMMQVIAEIEAAGAPIGITQITDATMIARSTVYRILNTLASHGVVSRTAEGDFTLGFRLVALARRVDMAISRDELVRLTHPLLEALAAETGETAKLSVLDNLAAEVIDVIQSPSAMAPSSRRGSRFPLHAGAASKLLLAFAPPEIRTRVMAEPLERFTAATRTEHPALAADLDAIEKTGISLDDGEWNASVQALAAPVFAADGTVLAAVSVTHFARDDGQHTRNRIAGPLTSTARSMSEALGYRSTPRRPEPSSG